MDYTYGISDDYLDDDDDGVMYSTRTYNSDSDDEPGSVFGMLTPKSQRKKLKSNSSDQESDFEKDMAAELAATVKNITAPYCSTSGIAEKVNPDQPTHYDKIYFDSDQDSSDEESSPKEPKRKEKHRILSNDELLYDPSMDDEDQAWVDGRRRSYQIKQKKLRKGKSGLYKPEPLPQSDAVLSCPACFTTLCLDCQRHEIYKNQYRAMFVFNCITDKTEILRFGVKEEKKKKFNKRKRKAESTKNEESVDTSQPPEAASDLSNLTEVTESIVQLPNSTDVVLKDDASPDDTFHPVNCKICSTKVGVQDMTELYHFFNVLTSY